MGAVRSSIIGAEVSEPERASNDSEDALADRQQDGPRLPLDTGLLWKDRSKVLFVWIQRSGPGPEGPQAEPRIIPHVVGDLTVCAVVPQL